MPSTPTPGDALASPNTHHGRVTPERVEEARAEDTDVAVHRHVEAVLRGYLAERRAELPEQAQTFAAAVDTLSDFALRGGKRIRPTFAW